MDLVISSDLRYYSRDGDQLEYLSNLTSKYPESTHLSTLGLDSRGYHMRVLEINKDPSVERPGLGSLEDSARIPWPRKSFYF
ncbi:Carboxypeptidase Dlike [Caligus rogercresseyi]|uniref:Carboxypeptidase Dlike n=1 Tax=Caligus rogercresseyi TaxID=217165 RepID=A0A7T8JVD6_CALRO|nr:Carboxypeptidase Dlike [Caligus rogercresseyi]